MIKNLIRILGLVLVLGGGYTVFGGEKAEAACMDTSGKVKYNLNFSSICTDANVYGKSANTVDVSWHVNRNYVAGKHYWEMNLQLYNKYQGQWNTIGTTYRGYVAWNSPSYRSWNINSLTWLKKPAFEDGWANARVRVKMTSGIHKGDVYYTNFIRINNQK